MSRKISSFIYPRFQGNLDLFAFFNQTLSFQRLTFPLSFTFKFRLSIYYQPRLFSSFKDLPPPATIFCFAAIAHRYLHYRRYIRETSQTYFSKLPKKGVALVPDNFYGLLCLRFITKLHRTISNRHENFPMHAWCNINLAVSSWDHPDTRRREVFTILCPLQCVFRFAYSIWMHVIVGTSGSTRSTSINPKEFIESYNRAVLRSTWTSRLLRDRQKFVGILYYSYAAAAFRILEIWL